MALNTLTSRTAREIAAANGLTDAVARLDHLSQMIHRTRAAIGQQSDGIVKHLLVADLARFVKQRAEFQAMILERTYPR